MTELNEQRPFAGQMNCQQCGGTISPQEKFYRDFDGCNYHLGCDNVLRAIMRKKDSTRTESKKNLREKQESSSSRKSVPSRPGQKTGNGLATTLGGEKL
jgi:hypothetical protein